MTEALGVQIQQKENLGQSLRIELIDLQDVSGELIQQWGYLAQRVRHPNAFFQPEYLLPLWKHACSGVSPTLLVARDQTQRLLGLAVLQKRDYATRLPFPHLDSFQHAYIFTEGMLIDHSMHDQVLKNIFDWLAQSRFRHGLRLRETSRPDQDDCSISQLAKACGFKTYVERKWQRAACVVDGTSSSDYLRMHCSKSRRKSLNRARRKLAQNAPVSFSLIHSNEVTEKHVQTFLNLEAMGWKGKKNTALSSQQQHSEFFSEMCRRMSLAGKLIFGELKVGQKVIASTCNLIHADTLFAFKIGWHPDFTAGSPGIWSELKLRDAVQSELPDIRLIDSCSQPGSHMETIWPDRMICRQSFFVQSRRSKMISRTRTMVRNFRGNRFES